MHDKRLGNWPILMLLGSTRQCSNSLRFGINFACTPPMKLRCPHSLCSEKSDWSRVKKHGSYFRPSDGRRIQRFLCCQCGRSFSHATFQAAYGQNRRRLNTPLKKFLCSGVSMRRAARLLGTTRGTVAKKLRFLGEQARKNHEKFLQRFPPVTAFQLDDLITIEHTKCKPFQSPLPLRKVSEKFWHSRCHPCLPQAILPLSLVGNTG